MDQSVIDLKPVKLHPVQAQSLGPDTFLTMPTKRQQLGVLYNSGFIMFYYHVCLLCLCVCMCRPVPPSLPLFSSFFLLIPLSLYITLSLSVESCRFSIMWRHSGMGFQQVNVSHMHTHSSCYLAYWCMFLHRYIYMYIRH